MPFQGSYKPSFAVKQCRLVASGLLLLLINFNHRLENLKCTELCILSYLPWKEGAFHSVISGAVFFSLFTIIIIFFCERSQSSSLRNSHHMSILKQGSSCLFQRGDKRLLEKKNPPYCDVFCSEAHSLYCNNRSDIDNTLLESNCHLSFILLFLYQSISFEQCFKLYVQL